MASSDAPTAPASADAEPPPGVGSGDSERGEQIDDGQIGESGMSVRTPVEPATIARA